MKVDSRTGLDAGGEEKNVLLLPRIEYMEYSS
jgi:hypothetical protein